MFLTTYKINIIRITLCFLSILFFIYVGCLCYESNFGLKPIPWNHANLGGDFSCFWITGRDIITNHINFVWNQNYNSDLINSHFSKEAGYGGDYIFPFNYPPTYLLILWVSGLLSYPVAFISWSLFGLSFFAATVRFYFKRISTKIYDLLLYVFSNPSLIYNMMSGQNGFLTASLMALGCKQNHDKPSYAFFFGLLWFKPQIAFPILPVLIAGKYYKSIPWYIAGTIIPVLITIILWGLQPWYDFFNGLQHIGNHAFFMVTIYEYMTILGLSHTLSLIIQLFISAIIMIILLYVSRTKTWTQTSALTISSIPLLTPYLLDYDLVMLSIPILIIMATKSTTLNWTIILCCYPLFFLMRALQISTHIPFGLMTTSLIYLMTLNYVLTYATHSDKNKDIAID